MKAESVSVGRVSVASLCSSMRAHCKQVPNVGVANLNDPCIAFALPYCKIQLIWNTNMEVENFLSYYGLLFM